MDRQCSGVTRSGERCRRSADGPHGFCYGHAPENAEQRRRAASRGGRAKPNKELAELKREVQAVIDGVLSGRIERGSASVALQGYNTLIRASEQERRLLETQEIQRRLEEIEDAIEQNRPHSGRGRAWD